MRPSHTDTHPSLPQSVTDPSHPGPPQNVTELSHPSPPPIRHRATPSAHFAWCICTELDTITKCIQSTRSIFTTKTHAVCNAESAKEIMHWKWETAHSTTSTKLTNGKQLAIIIMFVLLQTEQSIVLKSLKKNSWLLRSRKRKSTCTCFTNLLWPTVSLGIHFLTSRITLQSL